MRCEGAPKVNKALASFKINFLLVDISSRRSVKSAHEPYGVDFHVTNLLHS